MVDRNGGVFAISVSLTDKGGPARRSRRRHFQLPENAAQRGIKQSYFDEISHVLNTDFRYPSITRDMDYIEWLVDTMLRVPVEHALDAPYGRSL